VVFEAGRVGEAPECSESEKIDLQERTGQLV
jgi:hypothetical protein